jgi:hypothetical protein
MMGRFYGKHLTDGGWWSQGFDLNTGKRSFFGCYKPDSPRWDYQKGKPIKYEHPKGMSTGVFVPAIPRTIANGIIFGYGENLYHFDQLALHTDPLKPSSRFAPVSKHCLRSHCALFTGIE